MAAVIKNRISFDEFEVDTDRRLLLRQGEVVPIKAKTFELLTVLLENRGQLVSKDELLDKVWENQFVEENNLTVHVAALRKALGEAKKDHRYIITVPGKGYRFVASLDPPTTGEIVVETRRFARIVVDEKIEEQTNGNGYPDVNGVGRLYEKDQTVQPVTSLQGAKRLTSLRTGALLILIISFLIGGAYVWRNRWQGVAAATPFAQNNIRQLTTNGKVSIAALSPDGKLFAYAISDIGQKSLWLGYVDGGNHLQLRQPSDANYYHLAFSSDNRHLYFSIRDGQASKSALYRMPVMGGVEEKVLDDITHFALSADGRKVAFSHTDTELKKESLLVVDLQDGKRGEITSFPQQRGLTAITPNTISWSADGTRLAFAGVQEDEAEFKFDLVTVDVETGKVDRIRSDAWREVLKTAWLADGSGLIAAAIVGQSWSAVPQYRLMHVELPGGEMRLVTTDRSAYGSSLSLASAPDLLLSIEHRQLNNVWIAPTDDLGAARQITFSSFGKYDGLWGMDFTPDGKIIYTNSDTQSSFISQMQPDGSEQKPLTAPGAVDSVLNVSNDGRYIVFHSSRRGGFDIWRMNADGTDPVQLTFGKRNFQPFISSDGRWVYYKSWLNGVGELRRVPIEGGQEPEILNDKETSWLSFSPDRQYYAAVYKTDESRLAVFSAATHEIVRQFDLPKTGTLLMGSRWWPDSRSVVYRDQNFGYWRQPIDGGEPYRLENLPKEKFYNFAFSKDGRWFAFVRGQEIRDVVLFGRGE